MTSTTFETFHTIDHAELAEVVGGNYAKECLKGGAAGFIGGLFAGPKGMLAGGILGCIGSMVSHAIDKAKR